MKVPLRLWVFGHYLSSVDTFIEMALFYIYFASFPPVSPPFFFFFTCGPSFISGSIIFEVVLQV